MSGFRDRREAGRRLAAALLERDDPDPVVLALPRGGVPVALEVAKALGAPLDLVMVRKLGVPTQPELAAGAVVNGEHPQIVTNPDVVSWFRLGEADLDRLAERELAEIRRRRGLYLKGRAQAKIEGRTAIVVDDGIATGATIRAAIRGIRQKGPARIVLAVPVAPGEVLRDLQGEADAVICLETPRDFYAIGVHYLDFAQLDDAEVVRMMDEAGRLQDEAKDC